jgi:two-component system sensor histidine kinase/response regulator
MDVTQGIARTGANTAFYASLLRKFVKSQHDSTARIAQSLVERDTGQAQLLAHTLRGVAGNLGISALQTAAAHLEKVLHQQAPVAELQRAVERTSHILEATVEALRAAPGFALHNDADDPDTAEPQQLHALIAQLQQLLDQDDPSAQTLWDTRGRELASVCAHADQIDSAIASYEFENASQLLQADAAHWAALTPASPASP